MRRVAWLAAWPAGVALGAVIGAYRAPRPRLRVRRYRGAIAVELLAGYAVIGCGLDCLAARPGRQLRRTAGGGRVRWFLLEWNNPGVGSPLVFTIGLVLYAAAPPLIAHALLTYPAGPLGRLERAVVGRRVRRLAAAPGAAAGARVRPGRAGLQPVSANLLLVHGSASLYRELNRAGIYVGLAWTAAACRAGWVAPACGRRRRCAA